MSIGNIKDYTPNFKFIIPSFDIATWHDYIEENFRNIDALFYNLFGINNYSGTWKNITSYTVGQVLFVGEDKDLEGNDTKYAGRLVKVLVDHTTDNSDYFNVYYNLHPEYYELFADASTAQYYAQIAQENSNLTIKLRQDVENFLYETIDLHTQTQNLRNDALTFRNNAEDFSINAKNSANNAQVSAENAQDYLNLTQETYYSAINDINSTKSDAIIQIDQNTNQKIDEFINLSNKNTQTATNLLNQTQIAAQNAQNYANEAWGKISNVGDIFYSLRLDDELNGAVVCNGNFYELEDFTGTHSIKNLLEQNKLPYVSLEEYENTLNTYGSVRCFGYDVGGTQFRVPTLNDVYIKAGIANLPNEFNVESLPNITGSMGTFATSPSASTTLDSVNKSGAFNQSKGTQLKQSLTTVTEAAWARTTTMNFDASDSNSTYQNNAKVNPDNVRYRAFVQLANAATENAVISATSAISKLADVMYKSQDQTITGQKTVETTNEKTFKLKANDIDSSYIPLTDVNQVILEFLDKNGINLGYLFAHNLANGEQQIGFQAHRVVDGVDKYASIKCGVNGNGEPYTSAVVPVNTSNSSSIATTSWVKGILSQNLSDCITFSKNGNGYIKFPNDIQIVWGSCTTGSLHTYAKAFQTIYAAVATMIADDNAGYSAYIRKFTTTQIQTHRYNNHTGTTCKYIVIGRG